MQKIPVTDECDDASPPKKAKPEVSSRGKQRAKASVPAAAEPVPKKKGSRPPTTKPGSKGKARQPPRQEAVAVVGSIKPTLSSSSSGGVPELFPQVSYPTELGYTGNGPLKKEVIEPKRLKTARKKPSTQAIRRAAMSPKSRVQPKGGSPIKRPLRVRIHYWLPGYTTVCVNPWFAATCTCTFANVLRHFHERDVAVKYVVIQSFLDHHVSRSVSYDYCISGADEFVKNCIQPVNFMLRVCHCIYSCRMC